MINVLKLSLLVVIGIVLTVYYGVYVTKEMNHEIAMTYKEMSDILKQPPKIFKFDTIFAKQDSITTTLISHIEVIEEVVKRRQERIAKDNGYLSWNTFKLYHPNYIVNYHNAYDSL
jgi:hypothetical protein